jgi:hypothetical protein
MSRMLLALGGVLLVSALPAAAQPDPADKPAGEVAVPPDKPIVVRGSETEAVAAATADRTLRAESLDGATVNTIYLDGDGSLRIVSEGDGGVSHGRWFARGDNVCVEWRPRGRECWPFNQVADSGAPSVITSDRGQTIRVRVLG